MINSASWMFLYNGMFGQGMEIYQVDMWGELIDEDVSGTTIDVLCEPLDNVEVSFAPKNVSGDVLNLRRERFKITHAVGSQDFLRWGLNVFEEDMYSPEMVSAENPFIVPTDYNI